MGTFFGFCGRAFGGICVELVFGFSTVGAVGVDVVVVGAVGATVGGAGGGVVVIGDVVVSVGVVPRSLQSSFPGSPSLPAGFLGVPSGQYSCGGAGVESVVVVVVVVVVSVVVGCGVGWEGSASATALNSPTSSTPQRTNVIPTTRVLLFMVPLFRWME